MNAPKHHTFRSTHMRRCIAYRSSSLGSRPSPSVFSVFGVSWKSWVTCAKLRSFRKLFGINFQTLIWLHHLLRSCLETQTEGETGRDSSRQLSSLSPKASSLAVQPFRHVVRRSVAHLRIGGLLLRSERHRAGFPLSDHPETRRWWGSRGRHLSRCCIFTALR